MELFKKYQCIILQLFFEENQWNRYAHTIVGYISQESFEKIDTFFKVAQRIREQQIYRCKKFNYPLKIKYFIIIALFIIKL